MPIVLLEKDDAPNVSQNFTIGEHILGRGNKLQCSSKKVSRNHGVLKVTKDEGIFLKSTHNNPCFYKAQQSQNISLLTFGNSQKINHNDKIALSLDHGWFIVIIKDEEPPEENQANTSVSNTTNAVDETILSPTLKRGLDENEAETATKKSKRFEEIISENTSNNETLPLAVVIKSEPLDDAPSTSNNSSTSTINIKQEPEEEPTNEINLDLVKNEPEDSEKNNTGDKDCKEENKTENNSSEAKKENNDSNESKKEKDSKDDKPSTSGASKRPWRDRCWYGSSCYRKNGIHHREFKHPGDSDFDSDPEDSRPICCYGAGCYRKNREHRKRYRHPGQTKLGDRPPQQPQPPPKRRRVKPPRQPVLQDSEEMDDYDYSDPFLDDGSEDEYEPSQETDTESEYEDSQDNEEDHKRLLIEARKFTRNQK